MADFAPFLLANSRALQAACLTVPTRRARQHMRLLWLLLRLANLTRIAVCAHIRRRVAGGLSCLLRLLRLRAAAAAPRRGDHSVRLHVPGVAHPGQRVLVLACY